MAQLECIRTGPAQPAAALSPKLEYMFDSLTLDMPLTASRLAQRDVDETVIASQEIYLQEGQLNNNVQSLAIGIHAKDQRVLLFPETMVRVATIRRLLEMDDPQRSFNNTVLSLMNKTLAHELHHVADDADPTIKAEVDAYNQETIRLEHRHANALARLGLAQTMAVTLNSFPAETVLSAALDAPPIFILLGSLGIGLTTMARSAFSVRNQKQAVHVARYGAAPYEKRAFEAEEHGDIGFFNGALALPIIDRAEVWANRASNKKDEIRQAITTGHINFKKYFGDDL